MNATAPEAQLVCCRRKGKPGKQFRPGPSGHSAIGPADYTTRSLIRRNIAPRMKRPATFALLLEIIAHAVAAGACKST